MIAAQLQTLEISGLIELASASPELEYIFRHALTQEAVYNSLLKNDQKALHRAAGEVLENLYAGRVEQIAAHLAYHFSIAEDLQRAVKYYHLAGDLAMQRYATPEALELYTHAVQLAEASGQSTPGLFQARGLVNEILGDFEGARADQSHSLGLAEAQGDEKAKWQALLNLGMLWASRDYHKTDEFYYQALELARSWDEPDYLARSLNRVGNWHMNNNQLGEAIRYHQEALSIFTARQDQQGIANTLDLLGMSYGISADTIQAYDYLSKAIQAYRELNDRKGLASSLSAISLFGAPVAESDVVIPKDISLRQSIGYAQEALQIARRLSWRSGEAFCMYCLAQNLEAYGKFDAALEANRAARQIAAEINHSQWMIASQINAGCINHTLYDFEQACIELDSAYRLAKTIGSIQWVHVAAGLLGRALLSTGRSEEAKAILDSTLGPDDPPRSLGERMIWVTRAELALERGDGQTALDITDLQYRNQPLREAGFAAPRLGLVRARALVQLGLDEQALDELLALHRTLQIADARTMLWRCHTALYHLYRRMNRRQEANDEQLAALALITELASTLPEEPQRSHFTEHATAELIG